MLLHKIHRPFSVLFALLSVLSLIVLQSCGGSGGGSSHAGGGIGGTGKSVGTITAFGSIFVNKVEHETTGVPITVNGVPAGEGDLALGMKVAIATKSSKAVSIDYEAEIRGPVETVVPNDTLTVLGQTVLVDGTTRFKNVADLNGLNPGNDVDISGFFDADKHTRATYIELHQQPLQTFKVRGKISALDKNSKTFMINNLLVDYNGLSGDPELDDDPFVEVEADKTTYDDTIPKIDASKVEIEKEVPEGTPGEKVEIEGFITWVNPVDQNDFEVNGQPVNTYAGTKFEHGTLANVSVNAHVEVKGLVNSGGILVADKLEFE